MFSDEILHLLITECKNGEQILCEFASTPCGLFATPHSTHTEERMEIKSQFVGQIFLSSTMGWCDHVNILSLTSSLLPVAFVS